MLYTRRLVRTAGLSVVASALALSGPVAGAAAATGDLDPSFGAGGAVLVQQSFDRGSWVVRSLAGGPDGTVYLGGAVQVRNGNTSDNENRAALSRVRPDGTLDPTFGTGGTVLGEWKRPGYFFDSYVATYGQLLPLPDGGVLAVSQAEGVHRFSSSGSLDATFAGDGVLEPPADAPAGVVVRQPDGKIVLAGLGCWPVHGEACLTVDVQRHNADGTPDEAFGVGGSRTLEVPDGAYSGAVTLDSGGRLLVSTSGSSTTLTRLTTDGSLDQSFGEAGVRGGLEPNAGVMVDLTGRPVLSYTSGASSTASGVAELRRLTLAGLDDDTFGTAVGGELDTGSWPERAAHVQFRRLADGSFVRLSGTLDDTTLSYTRVLPDGRADTDVAPDGEKPLAIEPGLSDGPTTTAEDASGRLLFSGRARGREGVVLARLQPATAAPVPSSPVSTAVNATAGALAVSWSPPTSGAAPVSYDVELTPGSVRSVTGTSTTVAGLVNGTAYQVRVRAVASSGAGAWSAPVTGTPNGCAPTRFSDVAAAHPFCSDIAWMASEGISTGTVLPDGSVEYRPALPVSRQAMAPFLYRAAGSPAFEAPTAASFADVPTTHPFFREIEWMKATGISTGTTQPTGKPLYKPADPVSRQAMAPFLYRAASSPMFTTPTAASFADVPTTHPFFREIEWMKATGISTGTPQPTGKPLYKPVDPVSRQAMAAFLHRADGL